MITGVNKYPELNTDLVINNVKIIHAKDGVYDIYVNGKWAQTYGSADNVFAYLSLLTNLGKNFHAFTLEFEDRYYG